MPREKLDVTKAAAGSMDILARQAVPVQGRPIDAHEVLRPTVAGFSPTPKFPAITEAKALFEALAPFVSRVS
jgi:hypothetical protein